MRIVFLSVNDAFAGEMQRYLYENHPEWVVGSVISTCVIYKKTKLSSAYFLFKWCGAIYVGEMVRMKILRKAFRSKDIALPSKLAKIYGVELFFSRNINEQSSIERLKEWNPDIIISTNFNHYIGKNAWSVSKCGTWNLHKSFLPHYRGMAPSFYALLEGAKTVGASLHKVSAGFDTGDIVKQVEVPVMPDDSVSTLNLRVSEAGGRMLAAFLDNIDITKVETSPQPEGNWRNYSYPSRRDVSVFRRKKLRF